MRNNLTAGQTSGDKKPEYGETQPKRGDIKEQRGGPQSDQRVAETDRGSQNQATEGRNPQGSSE